MKINRSRRAAKTQNITPKRPLTYYRSPAKSDQSPFEKRQIKPSKVRKIFTSLLNIIIILAALIGLAYSLMVKPTASLSLNASPYHSRLDYEQAVSDQLRHLRNRNKVTFDKASINQSIIKQFPEISNVSIELPVFSQTPHFSINVAGPSLFLNNETGSYILDKNGVAVSRSEDLPKVKNLTSIEDHSNFPIHIGEQVFSTNQVEFIRQLSSQCQRAKVPIKSLSLPAKVQELDLRTSDQAYYIKLFFGEDVLPQVGQYLAARHQFDRTSTQPTEYLDVRVAGKIFYK
jgi:hypothetical protein